MHQLEFGMLLFNKTQKFLLYRIFGFWLTFSIFFKSPSFVLEAFPGRDPLTEKLVHTDQEIRTGRGPAKFWQKRTKADHGPRKLSKRGPERTADQWESVDPFLSPLNPCLIPLIPVSRCWTWEWFLIAVEKLDEITSCEWLKSIGQPITCSQSIKLLAQYRHL